MEPTAPGKELYSQIIGAVEKLDEMTEFRRKKLPERQPPIRLGAPNEYFFAEGLKRLADAETHGYRVWLTAGSTKSLLRRLEAGELDLIVATQKLGAERIHYLPLRQERFSLVAPKQVELPKELETLEQVEHWLLQQAWISYGPELPIIRRFYQEVFGKRPALRPEYIFPDLRTVLEAVRSGLGVSVLPDYLAESAIASRQVKVLWHPGVEVTNQLYLACQLGRLRESAIEWAIHMLRPNLDFL
jgi:DNA-binding transcriptional LysR family regulator